MISALLCLVHAAPLAAAGRLAHFSPPEFLKLTAELSAPPEIGRTVSLRVRGEVSHLDSLSVRLGVELPKGLTLVGPPLPPESSVGRDQPLTLTLELRADAAAGRAKIRVTATAAYPLGAVKRYALRRTPLYGPVAERELQAFVKAPPPSLEVQTELTVLVSEEEAAIGDTAVLAEYLPPGELGFAVDSPECPAGPAPARGWQTLLDRLAAGTPAQSWCRLQALALSRLRAGDAKEASDIWRQTLTRVESATTFGAPAAPLRAGLGVALALSGDTPQAFAAWTAAASAHAAFDAATLYQKLGQPDKAAADYRRALELSPGYTLARKRLRLIEGRR